MCDRCCVLSEFFSDDTGKVLLASALVFKRHLPIRVRAIFVPASNKVSTNPRYLMVASLRDLI